MKIKLFESGIETQCYVSVAPETVRILKKDDFSVAKASVGANPHKLCFGLYGSDTVQEIYLENTTELQILAEKDECLPKIDMFLYCVNNCGKYEFVSKFEGIKLQRTKGIRYFTENNLFTCCGFKYKAMYGDFITHNAKKNHFYEATVHLFERAVDDYGKLIYPETDNVYGIKLVVRKDD